MIDQNQTGSQLENQPVMGGNPYDLVDNKIPKNDVQQDSVQNIDSQVNQSVQQKTPVQNTNGIQVDENSSKSNQVVKSQAVQENTNKWPNNFTKKLIKFIAKLSGQPDPETWKAKEIKGNLNNQNTSQNNENTNVSVSQNKNTFDNIMWGVTWFLDKVEKKVEGVAGIDLDAPVKNWNLKQENNDLNNVAQNVQNQEVSMEKQTYVEPKEQVSLEELSKKNSAVEQASLQQSVDNVKQDSSIQENKQEIKENVTNQNINQQKIDNQIQNQVQKDITDFNSQKNINAPDLGAPPNLDINKPT